MAAFFIGQRVCVARPDHPQNAGMEGVYLGLLAGTPGWAAVDWAGQWPWNQARLDQLEPILPNGHRPAEYSFTELMDRCREGIAA